MTKPDNLFIDPPEGWKYGFPKIIPAEHQGRTREWLIEQGYPETLIDSFGDYFICRMWNGEEDDGA